MPYLNLPTWANPRKALKVLQDSIKGNSQSEELKARVTKMREEGTSERVSLPGFHLFDRGHQVSPYEWCVPAPRGDALDFLDLYESYINRDPGGNPLTSIDWLRVVIGPVEFLNYFGSASQPKQWMATALKILALLQHREETESFSLEFEALGASVRHRPIKSLRVTHRAQHFEVTPKACWNPSRAEWVTQRWAATDKYVAGIGVGPMTTSHPLARALLESDETTPEALWALNTCLRASQQGVLHAGDLDFYPSPKVLRHKGRPAGSIRKEAKQIRRECLEAALRELSDITVLTRSHLSELLVPEVLTSTQFRGFFGDPYRTVIRLKEPTKQKEKWKEAIQELMDT